MGDSNNLKSYSPNKRPGQGGFKEFLFNSETGQVMGRTGSSWAKIIIFYIIFFSGLAAFFLLNYYIFSLTLNNDAPKYTLGDSLIGTNPGLGFRPMPDPDTSADSTLIWFKRNDPEDYKFWTDQLDKFVEEIETGKQDGSQNLQTCSFDSENTATKEKACQVDIIGFKDCNKNNNFGYRLGEPCILIKLNKIYGWEPEPYGFDENDRFSTGRLEDDLNTEVEEKMMPIKLKEYILNYTSSLLNNEQKLRRVLKTVWINCDGENVADIENIGPVDYYPFRGIAGYYFPYRKQRGYQPPFIFVQLKRPMPGVLINVECKAFAKNVKPDRIMRLATTHFEILID